MKFDYVGEVLPSLAIKFCADEKVLFEFQSLGINPNEWPSGKEKDLVRDYAIARKANSHKLALFQVMDRVKALIAEHPSAGEMFEAAKADYDRLIKKKRVQDLVFAMQTDPANADKLITEYQSKGTSRIDYEDFFESAEALHMRLLTRLEENRLLVKIKDWELLSSSIGGFNPGRVGILMAKTGFGKTAFGLNFAMSAQKTVRTLFVNMEMIEDDIFQRIALMAN